jgi:molecular chaperone DnaK
VRLTRAELEDMVRPALEDSIGALRRALRSAGITPEQLDSVLLVGGSSRIPVVAQLVATELGRPVAVDAHPKHAVALGAALLAGAMPSAVASTPEHLVKPVPQLISEPATEPMPAVGQRAPELSQAVGKRTPEPIPAPSRPTPDPVSTTPRPPRRATFAEPATDLLPAPPGARDTPRGQSQRKGPRLSRGQTIGAAAAVLIGLGAAGFAALTRDHSPASGQGGPTATGGASSASCTNAIKANPRWVCLTDATLANGTLTITYNADFASDTPSIRDGYHLNIYGGDGVSPPDSIEGRQSLNPGQWYEEDQNPSVLKASSKEYQQAIGNASMVCARIATKDGVLVKDLTGTFVTGNCISIKRS